MPAQPADNERSHPSIGKVPVSLGTEIFFGLLLAYPAGDGSAAILRSNRLNSRHRFSRLEANTLSENRTSSARVRSQTAQQASTLELA